MSNDDPYVFRSMAGAEVNGGLQIVAGATIDSQTGNVNPLKTLLKLWPNGTSEYASEEDLREAAVIFWRCGELNPYGGIEIRTLSMDPNKPAGFRMNRDGTIEYFGGYAPGESTRRVLETIASLRP